jgi:hypothetical protein
MVSALNLNDTISLERSSDWRWTMPSEVSVPNAVQARDPTVDQWKRELAEARDQQTASASAEQFDVGRSTTAVTFP